MSRIRIRTDITASASGGVSIPVTGLTIVKGSNREGAERPHELRVKFPVASWNVSEQGNLSNDARFVSSLRGALRKMGFTKTAVAQLEVNSNEDQGERYVSLTASPLFLEQYLDLASAEA